MGVDILLANPFSLSQDPVEKKVLEPYFPLGILYIASVLREKGYSLALYDACFAEGTEGFEAALDMHQPKVVGIHALNTTRRAAMALGRMARARGLTVIYGGPDPTSRPEGYLVPAGGRPRPGDIVVVGEGEETAVELMGHLLSHQEEGSGLGGVRGIVYVQEDGGPVATQRRSSIEDLDALPYPAWDLVELGRYRQAWHRKHGYFSLSLITSRGCPYGCNWCAKPVFGRAYRVRSPQSVVAEQLWLRERFAPGRVRIVDDIFGLNKKWLAAWHQEALEAGAYLPFECLSRVDLVNPLVLQQLKDVGCQKIFFGAESGSQGVLDAMNKGIQVEQTRRAAEHMREAGLQMHFYIMVGYPGEERRDIDLTVELLKDTAPDSFSASVAYPLPGTEFYDRVKDKLLPMHDWSYSSENLLLFQRDKYSSLFYRWVERLLNKEWALARLRRQGGLLGWKAAKLWLQAQACRGMMRLLQLLQSRAWPFSLSRVREGSG